MKTRQIINLLCNSVSATDAMLRAIQKMSTDDLDKMSGNLLTTDSMSITRELIRELPERLVPDEIKQVNDDFYHHILVGDDLINTHEGFKHGSALAKASDKLFHFAYNLNQRVYDAIQDFDLS